MPLTATKLPDGKMYLVKETILDNILLAARHPPILALFKCTEGQRFEDGEVEKIRIPSYSGYTIKGKRMGLDVEYGYTLKSDKGGEKKELKALLDYGVKVDFGHYENGRPYLTIYDEKDTFLFGNDDIIKLRDFLNRLPLNPPQP